MPRVITALLVLTALATGVVRPARADVVDAGANGFSLTYATEVDASAADLFRALVEQVGRWWDPAHSYSGNAANFSIEPRAGGCFCETWPGGSVQHMVVAHIETPRTLVLQGGLGPLASLGVSGAMAWTLDPHAGRTQLQMTYNVGGFMPGGFVRLAPVVDGVLAAQVKRLKTFVETGHPN